jgi:hypothetical protein
MKLIPLTEKREGKCHTLLKPAPRRNDLKSNVEVK